MPPFPEVVDTLGALKQAGFRLCIISNTDDAIIAGNVAQMGGHIDRVITAEQANAYKPSRQIFAHAHASLGVTPDVVHICASPHLDHAAARHRLSLCLDRPGLAANACLTTVPTLPYPPWIGHRPVPPSGLDLTSAFLLPAKAVMNHDSKVLKRCFIQSPSMRCVPIWRWP